MARPSRGAIFFALLTRHSRLWAIPLSPPFFPRDAGGFARPKNPSCVSRMGSPLRPRLNWAQIASILCRLFMTPRQKPLLLSPAGDWECLRAAIENGADAIYFGLEEFNARLRAQNFTKADLPEVMTTLRARGVKGYVTMNTLIFPSELDRAASQIEACAAAGVDAMIIQDIGLIRLSKALAPALPIHGSTQMTVTSVEGIELARDLGAELVVLARETSLRELRKLRHDHPECDLPLEMFIHGALCVAYSGQCLTSESLGGRSANRGECAQACRMPYDLIVDGRKTDLGDKKISPVPARPRRSRGDSGAHRSGRRVPEN